MPQDITAEKTSLWIFGYGSLVWKPDFKFKRSTVGYVKGYKRRFWHGDNFHRGNDKLVRFLLHDGRFLFVCFVFLTVGWCAAAVYELLASGVVHDVTHFSFLSPQPGRVVTLIEDDDVSGKLFFLLGLAEMLQNHSEVSRLKFSVILTTSYVVLFSQASTWGVGYEVTGSQVEESLNYLNVRETACGGYITKMVDFFAEGESQPPVQALLYIATTTNPLYLGWASPEEIGAQIAVCSGKTGHNLEYLLRLAEFMRSSCPQVEDHHLFTVEAAALTVVAHLLASICLTSLYSRKIRYTHWGFSPDIQSTHVCCEM